MIWLNGALLRDDEALISALDHGITVGDGVFETLRTYGGVPFAVRRHLDRMERSASGLGLVLPARALLEQALAEVVEASGLPDARVRLTVTTGTGPLGSGRGESRPTVIAAVSALDPIPATTSVITVPWVRNERSPLAGLKTTSYGENVVALARAHEGGASEALFANTRGELCEGTGTNVFVVLRGRLLTPPLSSGCLAGITRELVLEVCDVTEEAIPFEALTDAEEIFLTSSLREVQSVHLVDERQVPGGHATSAAAKAYRALVDAGSDP